MDAYNAYNVIECLVTLARDFNRTVVFTIHQPRSNIAALFDQLILLAEGKLVYSGPFSKCQEYFDEIGHPCPPGFNIADYLVDLTMHASRADDLSHSPPAENRVDAEAGPVDHGLTRSTPYKRRNSIREWQEHQLYDPRPRAKSSASISPPSLQDEFATTQQWASLVDQTPIAPIESTPQISGHATPSRLYRQRQDEGARFHAAEHLAMLVHNYENSSIADQIRKEIDDAINEMEDEDVVQDELPKSKRIGWFSQFSILSRRTFKNLYRNPMLMLTHYSIAILMACTFCKRACANISALWLLVL